MQSSDGGIPCYPLQAIASALHGFSSQYSLLGTERQHNLGARPCCATNFLIICPNMTAMMRRHLKHGGQSMCKAPVA